MEWLLVIKIGMFLGIPVEIQYYTMESFDQCQSVKEDFIKGFNVDEEYQIYCIPKGSK